MHIQSLLDLLAQNQIDIQPSFDGTWVRRGSQWFRGYEIADGDTVFRFAFFGDFARGKSLTWESLSQETLTPEQRTKINEAKKTASDENQKERLRFWEQTKVEVEKEWDNFSTIGESPYLKKKGLTGLYGCRIEPHDRGARTIVPARDLDGSLWGYQTIFSEKLDIGDKAFRKGARKEACCHVLGSLSPGEAIYLAEGIATAITVYEALGKIHPVVSVFDAGNLLPVARGIRSRYPENFIVFCADNDQYPAKDGKIYHTGRVKAEQACKDVGNARVVLPEFKELGTRPTDFDDLRLLEGLTEVKRQLLKGPSAQVSNELRSLSYKNDKGVTQKPNESTVALSLLRHYGDNILVQNNDVFFYEDGYWKHQNSDGVKRIKQKLAFLYGEKAGSRDVQAAYAYLIFNAPTPPKGIDLFTPQFWSANFKNGTLHFIPNPGSKPKLEWRPHSRTDYHITQLPFDFPGFSSLSAVNAPFEEMLDRVWRTPGVELAADIEFHSKKRVLAQLMGACLMPCYSKIFFLVGPKGSGKSTIMKLINRMLSQENISRVDPSHFYGFHMETMVGKLVNMDTDINLHKPIQDDIIKKVIDRVPFRVSRKFQTDLIAPLPPIMIYGGNDLPRSMEGATGAFERRVVILTFGNFSAEKLGTGYKLDFDEAVWQASPAGLVAFALRGLMDLIECEGHFSVPESSKEALRAWDERSDPLGQFLDALRHGELDDGTQFIVDPKAEIPRKKLWECFNTWQKDSGERSAPWNNRTFSGAMRKAGFGEKIVRGERKWLGIGMAPHPESPV